MCIQNPIGDDMLNSSVYQPYESEKTASFNLSSDVAEWNDAIFGQFYTEIDYLPQGVSVNIVVSNIDESTGYAKGSIVVNSQEKRVNFPVIVEDFELKPFDTFSFKSGSSITYRSATQENVLSELHSASFGEVSDNSSSGSDQGVKNHDNTNDKSYTRHEMGHTASSWRESVDRKDFEKFAESLDPSTLNDFYTHSGDTINNIIEGVRTVVRSKDRSFGIDKSGIVSKKRQTVSFESDLFDPSMLLPLRSPTVCDIKELGDMSMEDLLEGGDNSLERFSYSNNGNLTRGIYVDTINCFDLKPSKSKLFLSLDARKYKVSCETIFGIEDVSNKPGIVERAVKLMARNHAPSTYNGIAIVFGAGDAFEAITMHENFKEIIVNGGRIYASAATAIIPTQIVYPTYVTSIKNPIYSIAVGKTRRILLVPESSTSFFSLSNAECADPMTPDFKYATPGSVNIKVAGDGIILSGMPLRPLYEMGALEKNASVTPNEMSNILGVMGVKKSDIKRVAGELRSLGESNVHGLGNEYIDTDSVEAIINKSKKAERIKEALCEYASKVQKNLVKVASIIEDPTAVDVVLSLNFVNEDNIKEYVDNVDEMRAVSDKLSSMLIASRMGLRSIDEGAIKKAIDGIESVILDLTEIKFMFNR